MYYQIIIVFHILLGLGIIGLVLMQQGKGADAGAAFGSGGGSSGSVFGAQGAASFLSRTTAIFAALFFATSLGLAILSGQQGEEVDFMDVPEDIKADVPLVDNYIEKLSIPDVPQEFSLDAAEEASESIVNTISEQTKTSAPEVDQTEVEDLEQKITE